MTTRSATGTAQATPTQVQMRAVVLDQRREVTAFFSSRSDAMTGGGGGMLRPPSTTLISTGVIEAMQVLAVSQGLPIVVSVILYL